MRSQIVRLVRLVASRRPHGLAICDALGCDLTFGELIHQLDDYAETDESLSGQCCGEVVSLDGTVSSAVALLRGLERADRVIVSNNQSPDEVTQTARQAAAVISGQSRRSWYSSRPAHAAVKEVVLYTSGTSGPPRLIVHDESSFLRCLWRTVVFQEQMTGRPVETDPADIFEAWAAVSKQAPALPLRFLCTLPMVSVGGLGMLLRSLLTGMTIRFVNLEAMLSRESAIRKWAPTHLAVTPYSARRVLRRLRTSPEFLRSVLHIGIGSARVDSQLALDLASATGTVVGVGYGSTELGGAALLSTLSDPTDLRPLSGLTVTAPKPGTSGPSELLLRTRAVAKGLMQPDGSIASLVAPDGVFHTGDIAEVTGDGAYRIRGRADRKILRGGRLIDPVECETALTSILGRGYFSSWVEV